MERKIHNFPSTILINETVEKEGHHPDDLGRTSTKFIWAICRYCGQPSRIRKGFYNQSKSACHKECKLKEQSEMGSPFRDKNTRLKAKQTLKERYGVEFASQNKEIAAKISVSKRHWMPSVLVNIGYEIKVHGNIVLFPTKNLAIACHVADDVTEDKNKFALSNITQKYNGQGIHVIHIFQHQWADRQKQLMNFINSNLGLNKTNIHARKCQVDNSEHPGFTEENHIQGKPSLVMQYFNLIHDGEIVASMTASRHHRHNVDEDAVVLSRLCFKSGVNLRGGSSKLFKEFIQWSKNHQFRKIISWSDTTWAKGDVYQFLGFTVDIEYPPDYFYWDEKSHRALSKQSQQKKKTGCPENMTEREWCLQRGLYRIWDCGKKKWRFDLSPTHG